jgi:Flp pilus assembly protein TadG
MRTDSLTARTTIEQFLSDQRGNVAMIFAITFLPLIIIAGGATDIARHESYRAQLQDGVDRSVLAAASIKQQMPVEQTVRDYLKTIDFMDEVTLAIKNTAGINSKSVSVTATYTMPTSFLQLVGIPTMDVVATATAVERRANIEISLMLDISGSMRWDNPTRLSLMKPAAQNFIDKVLTAESKPYTSISIIPYAGSVNIGSATFTQLGTKREHNYSSCIEFTSADYSASVIPFKQRTQLAHFTHNHQGVNEKGLEWSWCPHEATSITYLSNDAVALKNKIRDLMMHDGTGTAIAMNWGLQLLDPVMQPVIQSHATAGRVPATFSNRPASFDNQDTLKVAVLMTDGELSEQYRPKVYKYPRSKEADNNRLETSATAATNMAAACKRARDNGVIVFTIGFYITGNATAQKQMRDCATTPDRFYDVSGLDINTAFDSVASAIQSIKLTQ